MSESAQPVFAGTPDQWWENAEPLTEAEAAERDLNDWYISLDRGAYRLSTANLSSNESRKANLRRAVERGTLSPDSISTTVRRLLRIEVTLPDWMFAELVIADVAIGSSERAPWRLHKGRWQLIADRTIRVSEKTMATLNPRIAVITEQAPE